MGTIEKIKPWASTGSKVKPADVKIESGWIGGEQPAHEYENERMNTRDNIMNKMVDAVNRGSSGAEKLFNNLAAGAIKDIGFPFSDGNQSDTGNGWDRGACLYDHDGVKMVLSIKTPNPSGNMHLYGINTDTNTIDLDVDMSTIRFGMRWWNIVCDGQWIYLIGDDASASQRKYNVVALDINMVDKPGFYRSFGLVLEGNIDTRPVMKVLESGDIFVGGRWDYYYGAKKCFILDGTSGSIIQSGDVDMTADQYPSGDCVECGGHIYFTVFDSTQSDWYGVGMVDESDLTVAAAGTPGLFIIGPSENANWKLALATMGDHIAIMGRLMSVDYPTLGIYNGEDFTLYITPLVWSIAGSTNGPMFFDGHNLWLTINSNDTNPEMVIVKICPMGIHKNLPTADLQVLAGMDGVVLYDKDNVDGVLGVMRPQMVFDGVSIWFSSAHLGGGGIWRRVVDAFTR